MVFLLFICHIVRGKFVLGTDEKIIVSAFKPEILVGHPPTKHGTARGIEIYDKSSDDMNNVVVNFFQRKENKYLIKFSDNKKFLCGHFKPKSESVILCPKETDPNTFWSVEQGLNNKFALKTKGGKCLRFMKLDIRESSRGFYLHVKKCENSDYSWKIEKYNRKKDEESEEKEEEEKKENPPKTQPKDERKPLDPGKKPIGGIYIFIKQECRHPHHPNLHPQLDQSTRPYPKRKLNNQRKKNKPSRDSESSNDTEDQNDFTSENDANDDFYNPEPQGFTSFCQYMRNNHDFNSMND